MRKYSPKLALPSLRLVPTFLLRAPFEQDAGATIQGVLAYLSSENMISNSNRISGADCVVFHVAVRNPVCPSSSLPRYALLSQNDVCDTF